MLGTFSVASSRESRVGRRLRNMGNVASAPVEGDTPRYVESQEEINKRVRSMIGQNVNVMVACVVGSQGVGDGSQGVDVRNGKILLKFSDRNGPLRRQWHASVPLEAISLFECPVRRNVSNA